MISKYAFLYVIITLCILLQDKYTHVKLNADFTDELCKLTTLTTSLHIFIIFPRKTVTSARIKRPRNKSMNFIFLNRLKSTLQFMIKAFLVDSRRSYPGEQATDLGLLLFQMDGKMIKVINFKHMSQRRDIQSILNSERNMIPNGEN